jgi:hypothetical protein
MDCPYCGNQALFMSSLEFYGRDYKTSMYVCKPCNAYVGTHGNTTTPLGTMANAELRGYRNKIHSLFDPLWKSGKYSKHVAYSWLSEQLGIHKNQGHVAMLSVDQCILLIEILEKNNQTGGIIIDQII